jgi:NAD(P)-dependent dehydrogenase (short-subunit alcohol dehydrogenase family)
LGNFDLLPTLLVNLQSAHCRLLRKFNVSNFTGKVAIITGAAHGIGRATAKLLAGDGIQVVVADINDSGGAQVVADIENAGGKAIYIHTDVGKHEAIRNCVEQTEAQLGRLDYIVNNAYWSARGNVEEMTEEGWDRSMDIMLKAIFLFGKYGFPIMRSQGGGAMVNLASVHGLAADRKFGVYDAAKAAVINLTRAMALDYGPDNIRVNSVCPGWIYTLDEPIDEAVVRRAASIYALGRIGEPNDIAKVIRFLLSDDAGFVTGHALVADGGLTAQLQDTAANAVSQYIYAELDKKA